MVKGPVVDDAVTWVRRNLNFDPDDKQALVLAAHKNRGILNCTRQWGKSTVAAAKAVHHAMTTPESTVIVISPSERQSGELIRKIREFTLTANVVTKGDGMNALSLVFPNGARIVGLPSSESTVRGFSAVTLLLIDEASRVDDDLYQALRPMLATTDGSLWLMSTPWAKTGFFWEAWSKEDPAWERIRVPATECSRIRPAYLEEERREMGERVFRREFLCEFGDTNDSLFDRDLIEGALTMDFAPMVIM